MWLFVYSSTFYWLSYIASLLDDEYYFLIGDSRTYYTSVGMMQTPNFPDKYPTLMNVAMEIPDYTDVMITFTIVKEMAWHDAVLVAILHPRVPTPNRNPPFTFLSVCPPKEIIVDISSQNMFISFLALILLWWPHCIIWCNTQLKPLHQFSKYCLIHKEII